MFHDHLGGTTILPSSDRSVENLAVKIARLVNECWMRFSVAQVESVDSYKNGRSTRELLASLHPQMMFYSWTYLINYLSTIIHPLDSSEIKSTIIHPLVSPQIMFPLLYQPTDI